MKQFKIFIMLSKSKLYISVLILAISFGIMPIGPLINIYLRDQVSAEVRETLLKIQGEVVPEIESQFIGLGIPEVLDGVRNMLIPNISDDVVKVEAIPKTLLILQNRTIDLLPLIINSSGAANIIYNAIENVTIYNSTSWDNARDQFFNDYNFHGNYSTHFNSTIEGISEHMMGGTVSLNYSLTTSYRLLLGHTIGDTDYPGLLTDIETGIGLIEWLEFYEMAENDTDGSRSFIESIYACSWTSGQLQNVSAYITTYLWPDIVEKEYEPLDIETYADLVFYRQWSNSSDYPSGLSIEYIVSELEDKLKSAVAVDFIDEILRNVTIQSGVNLTLAREYFFNDYNLTANFSTTIKGISEYISNTTYSLNYTSIAQERLLDGYDIYPGILQQAEIGIGLIQWIDLYKLALGDADVNATMQTSYNATWTQLEAFGEYLLDYIYRDIVETIGQKGLEVGVAYIVNSTAQDLWDSSNPHSFVNTSGIKKWFDAYKGDITALNELNATFNLSTDQFTKIYVWLFDIIRLELVPIFFTFLNFKGVNVTLLEYAEILLWQQWANGTIDSSGLDLGSGIKGFEVGVPTPSNISFTITTALFNEVNESAFINKDGLLKWIEALNLTSPVRGELMTTFQLDNTTLNMITDWLFTTFKTNVVPNLVEIVTVNPYKCNPITGAYQSYTLTELAVLEFYRQWANGSLFKEGLDPVWHNQTGLDSIAGWEAGIPQPTNISYSYVSILSPRMPLPGCSKIAENIWNCSISTAERLWSPTTHWDFYCSNIPNELAFVTPTGFPIWIKAIETKSTYNYLKNEFELSNDQMDAILDWLLFIRENFALDILQEESGLPLNHYELGNIYFMNFTITASVLIAISALFVIWAVLSKRK